jgi:hypothetical protein
MSPPSSSHDATHDQVAADGITPELALVSPELAEAGRAELPSRPWEAAAGRRGPPTARRSRGPSADHRARRPRRITGRHWAVALAAMGAAAVLLGALAGVPALPDVSKNASDESRTAVGSDAADLPAASGNKRAPGRKARARSHRRKEPAEPRVDKPSLQPRGGYVVSPSGSLLTDASGRKIETFVLPLECGGRPLVLADVPVSGRSLTFSGIAVEGNATVRLTARVLDARRLRGVVAAEGPRCPSAPVTFLARLS